jgi:glycosyltransferase involved in cell wall biosynthesis
MSQRSPQVSIGIPVRNGEKYLRFAIDSLLAQTMGDLEVVVCDNCSSDNTEEICRQYVRLDPRVKYFRNERDLGPAQNHTRCFENSTGKYFRWHAHDDMCEPRYLEAVVPVLDSDPTVSNAHTWTRVINDKNETMRNYDYWARTDHPNPATRFNRLVNVKHRQHVCYEIFGLMRREQMAQTELEPPFPHGDRFFLVRMVLRGRFVEVPERLFLARCHPSQSIQSKTTRAKYMAFLGTGPLPPAEWWDASKKGKVVFPEWKLVDEYWRAIGEVPLSLGQSLRCRMAVMQWCIRNFAKLGRDVAYAVEHAVTRGQNLNPTPPAPTPRPPVRPVDRIVPTEPVNSPALQRDVA